MSSTLIALKNPKLSSNILWMLIDRGIRLLVAFAVGVIVARQLGPELYGKISFAQASVGLLNFLNLLAIESIVIRMLVDEPKARKEILGSALVMRVAGGALTIVAAVLLGFIFNDDAVLQVVIPIIAAVTLFQSLDVVEYLLRLKLMSQYATMMRALALLVGALLRIGATSMESPLFALGCAMLLESALVAVGMAYALRWGGESVFQWQPSVARIYKIFSQSLPIILSAIAVAVYVRFGYVLLGEWGGYTQVGYLSVANVITEILHAIPVAVVASYGPVVLSGRKESMEEFKARIFDMLRCMVAVSVILSILISLMAATMIPWIFGDDFSHSQEILVLLVWSIVFVYISTISELWIVGHGLQRYLVPKTLITAIIYIALNIFLIPLYQAKGVAIATLIAYSFSAFWSNLLFSSTRPLFFMQCRALVMLRK